MLTPADFSSQISTKLGHIEQHLTNLDKIGKSQYVIQIKGDKSQEIKIYSNPIQAVFFFLSIKLLPGKNQVSLQRGNTIINLTLIDLSTEFKNMGQEFERFKGSTLTRSNVSDFKQLTAKNSPIDTQLTKIKERVTQIFIKKIVGASHATEVKELSKENLESMRQWLESMRQWNELVGAINEGINTLEKLEKIANQLKNIKLEENQDNKELLIDFNNKNIVINGLRKKLDSNSRKSLKINDSELINIGKAIEDTQSRINSSFTETYIKNATELDIEHANGEKLKELYENHKQCLEHFKIVNSLSEEQKQSIDITNLDISNKINKKVNDLQISIKSNILEKETKLNECIEIKKPIMEEQQLAKNEILPKQIDNLIELAKKFFLEEGHQKHIQLLVKILIYQMSVTDNKELLKREIEKLAKELNIRGEFEREQIFYTNLQNRFNDLAEKLKTDINYTDLNQKVANYEQKITLPTHSSVSIQSEIKTRRLDILNQVTNFANRRTNNEQKTKLLTLIRSDGFKQKSVKEQLNKVIEEIVDEEEHEEISKQLLNLFDLGTVQIEGKAISLDAYSKMMNYASYIDKTLPRELERSEKQENQVRQYQKDQFELSREMFENYRDLIFKINPKSTPTVQDFNYYIEKLPKEQRGYDRLNQLGRILRQIEEVQSYEENKKRLDSLVQVINAVKESAVTIRNFGQIAKRDKEIEEIENKIKEFDRELERLGNENNAIEELKKNINS